MESVKSVDKLFKCNICNKNYKSKNSLGNHNRKFHPKSVNLNQNEHLMSRNEHFESQNEHFECRYCNKKYKHVQSKNRHEKNCNKNIEKTLNEKCKKLKKENEELKLNFKKENEELKLNFQKQMDEMKEQLRQLLNKNCKIHPKTLQKINKQLNNNINTQNNTQNNIQNNNINIIGFDKMNLDDIFSEKEQLKILKKKFGSLNYLIEYAHFNKKYPQLKNIKITNLKDNFAYKYDEKKKKFIATSKDELINDLVDNRMLDLDEFQSRLFDKLSIKEQEIITELLNNYYKDDKFTDKKREEIKFIIYNNSE